MLKSLPAGAEVVGTVMSRLTVRKLNDPCRPKHIIFEVTRTDGSMAELHFQTTNKLFKIRMAWALYL